MRNKVYIFVVLALAFFVASIAPQAWAESRLSEGRGESAHSRGCYVKAAFLYNFIKFVDWPEEVADSNEPITIGIIGEARFENAFEPVKDKKIKGRSLVIKQFDDFKELMEGDGKDKAEPGRKIEAIKKCHLLFICSSEKKNLAEIMKVLKGSSVLTVGEMSGFLEAGGIINFLMEEGKVRFEISIAAAKQAGLKIRSKLLRLAERVIREKDEPQKADKQTKGKKKPSARAEN